MCFDICYIFLVGYDIVNDLDGVLEEFDKVIGIERLKIVYLNDSMMLFGDKKDRYVFIGEGKIGLKVLIDFMEYFSLKYLLFFLEIFFDDEGYKREFKMIKEILFSK